MVHELTETPHRHTDALLCNYCCRFRMHVFASPDLHEPVPELLLEGCVDRSDLFAVSEHRRENGTGRRRRMSEGAGMPSRPTGQEEIFFSKC